MKREGNSKKVGYQGVAAAMALLMKIGLSMIVPIMAGFFLGTFIDGKTGMSPLFLVICLFAGIGLSFRSLYAIANKHKDNN